MPRTQEAAPPAADPIPMTSGPSETIEHQARALVAPLLVGLPDLNNPDPITARARVILREALAAKYA